MAADPSLASSDRLMRHFASNPLTLQAAIDRELARRDLRSFIRRFWPIVEQAAPYKHGWHIDCICDHLQAVIDGDIRRLLINIPPRHMKSILCSVMFPAWVWLQRPDCKFLNASYDQHLSIRDCRRSRNIIQHPLYREMLEGEDGEPSWTLSSDQNVKSMYENTLTGQRYATSVTGALTGEGGDIIIVDDPHNVKQISPTTLDTVKTWWTEAMPTRLNDPNTGVFIVIMQRVHEDDLSGLILNGGEDYVHVCLPARYEGESRILSPLGWTDRRTRHLEPLWPNHYDEAGLSKVEAQMTEYSRAGQLQQRPAPREGGMFKGANFHVIPSIPEGRKIVRTVRYWDKAGTDDDGAFTAGVCAHMLDDNSLIISDCRRGQWSYGKREDVIKATGIRDFHAYGTSHRAAYEIRYEQEPGSGGKESAERTKANLLTEKDGRKTELNRCRITIDRVTGSKETRAEPYAVEVENNNVALIDGPWVRPFLDEHTLFPNGKYKDQVDAAAGAIMVLTAPRKKAGGW